MPTLEQASLSPIERRVLQHAVRLLVEEFGGDLHGVWLYGSRARGEEPGPESDVDLLVVADGEDAWDRAGRAVDEAAEAEGASPVWFMPHVYSRERIARRREIRSFFIQEVDRDKIVLWGEP